LWCNELPFQIRCVFAGVSQRDPHTCDSRHRHVPRVSKASRGGHKLKVVQESAVVCGCAGSQEISPGGVKMRNGLSDHAWVVLATGLRETRLACFQLPLASLELNGQRCLHLVGAGFHLEKCQPTSR